MTLLIAAAGAVSIALLVVALIWFRRAAAVLLPALFVVLFWGTVHAVDYLGYAVDADHLAGREAVVLQAIGGNEWIYLLVRTETSREPRLVRIAATEENRQGAEAVQQQAAQGLTIIRFGNGNPTDPQRGATAEDEGPGFQILDLEDSETYSKDVASSG